MCARVGAPGEDGLAVRVPVLSALGPDGRLGPRGPDRLRGGEVHGESLLERGRGARGRDGGEGDVGEDRCDVPVAVGVENEKVNRLQNELRREKGRESSVICGGQSGERRRGVCMVVLWKEGGISEEKRAHVAVAVGLEGRGRDGDRGAPDGAGGVVLREDGGEAGERVEVGGHPHLLGRAHPAAGGGAVALSGEISGSSPWGSGGAATARENRGLGREKKAERARPRRAWTRLERRGSASGEPGRPRRLTREWAENPGSSQAARAEVTAREHMRRGAGEPAGGWRDM